jgi:hypothetical protein
MSLYFVQKFLYELNRSESFRAAYTADRHRVLDEFELTDEEIEAITSVDIGKLFHFGVNGQILMHFAAFHQIDWQDYLQRMRDGIAEHGPVREGVYAMTTGVDEVVAPVHEASRDTVDDAAQLREPGAR